LSKPASVEILHERVINILRLGPPAVTPGYDTYLETAARAMRITYAKALLSYSYKDRGIVSLRAYVKKAMFSMAYADGQVIE
jgi:hypothetical protein